MNISQLLSVGKNRRNWYIATTSALIMCLVLWKPEYMTTPTGIPLRVIIPWATTAGVVGFFLLQQGAGMFSAHIEERTKGKKGLEITAKAGASAMAEGAFVIVMLFGGTAALQFGTITISDTANPSLVAALVFLVSIRVGKALGRSPKGIVRAIVPLVMAMLAVAAAGLFGYHPTQFVYMAPIILVLCFLSVRGFAKLEHPVFEAEDLETDFGWPGVLTGVAALNIGAAMLYINTVTLLSISHAPKLLAAVVAGLAASAPEIAIWWPDIRDKEKTYAVAAMASLIASNMVDSFMGNLAGVSGWLDSIHGSTTTALQGFAPVLPTLFVVVLLLLARKRDNIQPKGWMVAGLLTYFVAATLLPLLF